MKKIFIALYYLLAYRLPDYAYPCGKCYNAMRITLLQRVIKVGEKCRIQQHVYVGDGNNVEIGNFCRINDNVKLDNVKIGNYVMIARRTQFVGKMHKFSSTEVPMLLQKGDVQNQTIVEDDVWIGLNVVIMPGITIKKGCIIGAGAVLTKDTVEYGIYGGVPAKLISKRK